MTKTELESKHIAELHELAAEVGVERYRMLSRAELIEKLADGNGRAEKDRPRERSQRPRRERKPRERRERPPDSEAEEPAPAAPEPPEPAQASDADGGEPPERPKRKRRRRRWGRRRKGVRVPDLLLPGGGRQAIVYAEGREACTALLREVAAELSEASKGPDPIALLVDPVPEELADWKREAPKAEIVSAGKAKHAEDAIAQARSRARAGEDVIILIDSLTRYAEDFAGAEEARELFEAAAAGGDGSLTVVAAIERS